MRIRVIRSLRMARVWQAQSFTMPQKKENGYVIRLSDIPEEVAQRAKFMVVSLRITQPRLWHRILSMKN